MYSFKLIDEKDYNASIEGGVQSPIYTKTWLEYIQEWRHLNPAIVQIQFNSHNIGFLCGFSKSFYGIKFFGSPLPGCILPYMGFYLFEPDSVNYPILLKEIFCYLKKIGFHYISICDIHNTSELLAQCDFEFNAEKRETYILDLDKPLDEIKKGFSKTYRNYINFFEKHDGIVSEDYSYRLIENHNSQLAEVYERDGISSPNIIKKYKIMFDKCNAGKMLYCIKADIPTKESIGSSIYLYGGSTAFFLTNATYTENLNDRPNQSMMWTAIQHFHKCNIKKLDLVGPGDYKKYYGGEKVVFYNVTVSKFGLHKIISFLRKMALKNKIIQKIIH